MGTIDKLNKLKADLTKELELESPNLKKVSKLRQQIMLMGVGLTGNDINPRFKLKP